MRTTLTLDDDVAAKLKAESRRNGRPFRDVVNDALRRGLLARPTDLVRPFKATVRDLGELLPGLSLDNVGELLDRVEGPLVEPAGRGARMTPGAPPPYISS